MPSIKEYNRKISSLKNTSKITKTMKMVSASKLRKAQDAQRNASAYAEDLNKLIYRIGGASAATSHALLQPRAEIKNVLFIVFSSDKGLCGGFNNNLFKFVDQEIQKLESDGKKVTVSCCGRRAYTYYQKRADIRTHYENITPKPDPLEAHKVAKDACAAYEAGEFDEVYLIYNHFISPIAQTTRKTHMLPLQGVDFAFEGDHEVAADFIAEPDVESLVNVLVPKIFDFLVYFALLENSAGEHGARMTAMENATKNATEMVDKYTLLRNRARQAAITTELIEIISGAEAL